MRKDSHFNPSTQRIEAFSDGVFAIAITLLILEIKVPHLNHATAGAHTPGSLGSALLNLWPSYFAYIFSFVMIGIYWANHHFLFRLFRCSDHIFSLLNVFFLMCISFLPFPTAVLAEYMTHPQHQQAAATLYAIGLLLPAFSWFVIWLYASYGYRLIDTNLEEGYVTYLKRQYLLSTALYSLAILISLWHAIAALALCISLTLLYLLPPKAPVYRE